MAVSRPLLLTLVGAMLMAATFMAARGARTAAEPASQGIVAPSPAPQQAGVANGKPGAGEAKESGAKAGDAAKQRAEKSRADKIQAREEAAAKEKSQAQANPATEQPAKVVGLPAPVTKALENKKVVVLFFFQNAADDDATARAVNSVADIGGVRVFKDTIVNLSKYRAVTASLGVTQAPAVVVVGRGRQARLVEGFVDEATLSQIVVDAR